MLLGTVDRSSDDEHLQVGRAVQALLTQSDIPAVVLITHAAVRA
jgi:hypothetical protein